MCDKAITPALKTVSLFSHRFYSYYMNSNGGWESNGCEIIGGIGMAPVRYAKAFVNNLFGYKFKS